MSETRQIDPPSQHASGLCPRCKEYVEYSGIHDFDDNCLYWPWTCKCGLRGNECHEVLFSHHEVFRDEKAKTRSAKPKGTSNDSRHS